jgi:hypothetical protein
MAAPGGFDGLSPWWRRFVVYARTRALSFPVLHENDLVGVAPEQRNLVQTLMPQEPSMKPVVDQPNPTILAIDE